MFSHKERSYMDWVHFSNANLCKEYLTEFGPVMKTQHLSLDLHNLNDNQLAPFVELVSHSDGLRLNFYENQSMTLAMFTQFMKGFVKNQDLKHIDIDLR